MYIFRTKRFFAAVALVCALALSLTELCVYDIYTLIINHLNLMVTTTHDDDGEDQPRHNSASDSNWMEVEYWRKETWCDNSFKFFSRSLNECVVTMQWNQVFFPLLLCFILLLWSAFDCTRIYLPENIKHQWCSENKTEKERYAQSQRTIGSMTKLLTI